MLKYINLLPFLFFISERNHKLFYQYLLPTDLKKGKQNLYVKAFPYTCLQKQNSTSITKCVCKNLLRITVFSVLSREILFNYSNFH